MRRLIRAGNRIAKKPYKYGGGHGSWNDSGYDCSGSVSYVLHHAGLLRGSARPSGGFMNWGFAGRGKWVTVYAHGGHMFLTVAGLRFDTTDRERDGTRWHRDMRSTAGYAVRHPGGYRLAVNAASGSALVGREVALPGAADGAEPVVRDVLERGARGDAPVGVALGGVVDESAGLADPHLLSDGLAHAAAKVNRVPPCAQTVPAPARSSTPAR